MQVARVNEDTKIENDIGVNEMARGNRKGVNAGEKHPLWGVKGELHHNWGRKVTEEQKAKFRKTMGKKVIASTGEKFDCMHDASQWAGLADKSSISACAKGRKKHAGKHPETGERVSWRYAEEC